MIKKKHAKDHLRKKVDNWIASLPKKLGKKVWKCCFVTGGSIVSLLTDEEINDYDIYLTDKEVLKELAEHYVEKLRKINTKISRVEVLVTETGVKCFIKSAGVLKGNEEDYDYFEGREEGEAFSYLRSEQHVKKDYHPYLISDNAISLNGDVQVITRFCGDPSEVHKNFDFAHCTCYYTHADGKLIIPEKAAMSIMSKELMYTGSLFPICSLVRTRKFIRRGWNIHAGEYLKMAFQINELNLKDIEVLNDQLTGVDAYYFAELIKSLKDGEREVTSTYISELVDIIFD